MIMKPKKRWMAFAAVALATAAVVPLTFSGASSAAAKRWVIGVSNGYYGNTARAELEAEIKAYAALPSVKRYVKKVIINNAGTSVAAQVSAVDAMIAEHVNAILLDGQSVTAFNSAIEAAHRAGIPVVAYNTIVSSPVAYHVQTVGEKFGAVMMSGLLKLLHHKGNIVLLRGIAGNAVDAAEARGFNAVLKKYPHVHVLATVYPKWDTALAQTDMASLLSRYSNIDGVFTEGGMEQGVVRAYVAAHRKFVPVSGTDENGFACQLKKYASRGLQGVQVGTAIYAGAVALHVALRLLSGHKEPHFIPGTWKVWFTKQSISHCTRKLSPGLFLQVASPTNGINLRPAQVNKYL